jgi:alpha-tubulin suppressor-like RCC1 family protein
LVSGIANAISVSAGGNGHVCALLEDKTVKCWGQNGSGQLGDPSIVSKTNIPNEVPNLSNVTSIKSKKAHTCALLEDKTVKCWGENALFFTVNSNSPGLVSGLADVSSISVGTRSTCALLDNGTIKCWGFGPNGELGVGTDLTDRYSDIPLTVHDISNAVSLSDAYGVHCATLSDKEIKCWGRGLHAAVTLKSDVPVPLSYFKDYNYGI